MSKNPTISAPPSQGGNNGNMVDLSGFMFNPVNSTIALIQLIKNLLFSILRASCVPAEMIFRRKFGERYFNLWLYIAGTTWLYIFAVGIINIPAMFGFDTSVKIPNYVIFIFVWIVFFWSFLRELFLRKFRKIDVDLHTRYDGDPLKFLYKLPFAKDSNGKPTRGNPKEYFVRQVYEPLFLLLSGVMTSIILNPQTGSWLIISAIAMALKEYVKSQHTRNILLDHIDAEITSQNIKAALAGDPPAKTKGIYIAGLPSDGKQREQLNGILNKDQERFTAV